MAPDLRYLTAMRHCSWLFAAVTLSGCIGSVKTSGDSDRGAEARAFFESQVEASLEATCASCHDDEAVAWNWMTPSPDRYTAITEYGALLDFESPSSSLLLNKGAHSGGPALEADQYALVLEWVRMEAAWRIEVPDEVIETPVVLPVPGPNTIPLDSLGLGGSTITFNYQALASGMYLTELKLIAGPTGATLEHPLFVTWEGESPTPDPVDRFVDLAIGADAGGETPIGVASSR